MSNRQATGQHYKARSRTEKVPDRNEQRRNQYASDPVTRERTQEAARQRYRKQVPLKSPPLARGLLTKGVEREVVFEDCESPVTVETYTVQEAAEALGKAVSNFRRWLDRDLIPLPCLNETSRNVRVYSAGELRILAEELAAHEREFAYYGIRYEDVRHRIFQRMQGYRSQYI